MTARQSNRYQGKYGRLSEYLSSLTSQEWRTSFAEIESILGFRLPASARRYSAWWANERCENGTHSHARAWMNAGWETARVNLAGETLVFRRVGYRPGSPSRVPSGGHGLDLDRDWPVHRAGGWPKGLTFNREEIYRDALQEPDVR